MQVLSTKNRIWIHLGTLFLVLSVTIWAEEPVATIKKECKSITLNRPLVVYYSQVGSDELRKSTLGPGTFKWARLTEWGIMDSLPEAQAISERNEPKKREYSKAKLRDHGLQEGFHEISTHVYAPHEICDAPSGYQNALMWVNWLDVKQAMKAKADETQEGSLPPSVFPNPIPRYQN